MSHESFNQWRHWPSFARQQGIGQEVPAGDDEADDGATSTADSDIPFATLFGVPAAQIPQPVPVQIPQPVPVRQRTDARPVKRFVLARTELAEQALKLDESVIHDAYLATRWTIDDASTF